MPLYEYKCHAGHRAEVFRPVADRDAEAVCVDCCSGPGFRIPMKRELSRVSPPVVRPTGYNLKPGDRGYWDFSELRSRGSVLPPFAKEEERQHSPAHPPSDDEPVLL